MRSNLRFKNEDGSESLAYEHDKVIKFNPLTLSEDLNLPAWDKSIGKERMKKLLDIYNEFTDERYFANLKYFLDAVIPAAEKNMILNGPFIPTIRRGAFTACRG